MTLTSSDTSVVTVDATAYNAGDDDFVQFNVTAIGPGSAIITATCIGLSVHTEIKSCPERMAHRSMSPGTR